MRNVGGVVVFSVLVSLASCGGNSDATFLPDEVLQSMHATDVALSSGNTKAGCDMLVQSIRAIEEWSGHARGNLAPLANEIAERLEGLAMYCSDRDIAETRAEWQRQSKRLRDAAHMDSGWGQIGLWVLAFAAMTVLGFFLRRLIRR